MKPNTACGSLQVKRMPHTVHCSYTLSIEVIIKGKQTWKTHKYIRLNLLRFLRNHTPTLIELSELWFFNWLKIIISKLIIWNNKLWKLMVSSFQSQLIPKKLNKSFDFDIFNIPNKIDTDILGSRCLSVFSVYRLNISVRHRTERIWCFQWNIWIRLKVLKPRNCN